MRTGPVYALAFTAMLAAASGTARAQDTQARQDSNVVAAAGVHIVRIRTEAGRLRVSGDQAATTIRTSASLRASSPDYLEWLHLRVARHGDTLEIDGQFPQVGHGKDFDVAAAIDMVITVPSALAVDSRSTMGDVTVNDVASISIENNLGDVTVQRIHGDVRVVEQLGIVSISDVDGQVLMPKGAGQVSIRNVNGSVDVSQHDMGPLRVAGVGQNVHVGSMRSGFVSVEHVGGNLTVEHLHDRATYTVQYHDVRGAVDVPGRQRN